MQIRGKRQGPTFPGSRSVRFAVPAVAAAIALALPALAPAATQTLTVHSAGTGSGTVTSSPAGIECGATCSASFAGGATVTLTGAPGADTQAVRWAGCTSVNAEDKCVVTMSAAKTVTATFSLVKHQLTVTKAGTGLGAVTSSPAGIFECGATCTANFEHGTTVALTATPGSHTLPVQWSGCDSVDAEGRCLVTMSEARSVTATFEYVKYQLTVARIGTGSGTVTSVPAGIECGALCSGQFPYRTHLALTAAPAAGSVFARWAGACTGTGACAVTLGRAKTVRAVFTLSGQRTLTVTKAGSGQGTVTAKAVGIQCGTSCISQVPAGKKVSLSAAATTGSTFAGWSGACSGTAPCKVTMSEARSVTATFAAPAAAALGSSLKIAPNAKVRRGLARVGLTCSAAAPCTGTLTLAVRLARKGKTLTIGQAPYALAAGSSKTLEVSLSRRARRVLRRRGALSVRASGAGATVTAVRLESAKKQ